MNKSELIKTLQEYPDNMEIRIYNSDTGYEPIKRIIINTFYKDKFIVVNDMEDISYENEIKIE
jgi:hypothetical protein